MCVRGGAANGCPMEIPKQCRVVHWTPIGWSWYYIILLYKGWDYNMVMFLNVIDTPPEEMEVVLGTVLLLTRLCHSQKQ